MLRDALREVRGVRAEVVVEDDVRLLRSVGRQFRPCGDGAACEEGDALDGRVCEGGAVDSEARCVRV